MLKIYPYESLGHSDFGWLNAHYHFSFARYHNPGRTGFGKLLVINDDIIKAGTGFDTHGHDNMEIITYVRSGAISHKDSHGHEGRTAAGDVQVMSAGSGIRHAEHNREDGDTTLYQIWIEPNEKDVKPRWDAMSFPKEPVTGALKLLVSGRQEDSGKDALFIHADAAVYGGRLAKGTAIAQPIKEQGYLLVSEGKVTVDGMPMKKGDGAEITEQSEISITAGEDAELVLIDVAG